MRPEKLYLVDIVEASTAIERFCSGIERDAFLDHEILQSAVLQKLIVIGEAASRLSQELKESHRSILWLDIVGFRIDS